MADDELHDGVLKAFRDTYNKLEKELKKLPPFPMSILRPFRTIEEASNHQVAIEEQAGLVEKHLKKWRNDLPAPGNEHASEEDFETIHENFAAATDIVKTYKRRVLTGTFAAVAAVSIAFTGATYTIHEKIKAYYLDQIESVDLLLPGDAKSIKKRIEDHSDDKIAPYKLPKQEAEVVKHPLTPQQKVLLSNVLPHWSKYVTFVVTPQITETTCEENMRVHFEDAEGNRVGTYKRGRWDQSDYLMGDKLCAILTHEPKYFTVPKADGLVITIGTAYGLSVKEEQRRATHCYACGLGNTETMEGDSLLQEGQKCSDYWKVQAQWVLPSARSKQKWKNWNNGWRIFRDNLKDGEVLPLFKTSRAPCTKAVKNGDYIAANGDKFLGIFMGALRIKDDELGEKVARCYLNHIDKSGMELNLEWEPGANFPSLAQGKILPNFYNFIDTARRKCK
jgi:hypothetical protein